MIQLIEAAVNPTGGLEGARLSTILFEYQVSQTIRHEAGPLFNLGDSCNTAVKTNIPRVVYEYWGVENGHLVFGRDQLKYPQVGASSTLPFSALLQALEDIQSYSKPQSRPATVIILTDGKSDQTTLSGIIGELRRDTAELIAAGIGSANDINQAYLEELASSPADAIYESDLGEVVSFARRIVERMRDTAALCLNQGEDLSLAIVLLLRKQSSNFHSDKHHTCRIDTLARFLIWQFGEFFKDHQI